MLRPTEDQERFVELAHVVMIEAHQKSGEWPERVKMSIDMTLRVKTLPQPYFSGAALPEDRTFLGLPFESVAVMPKGIGMIFLDRNGKEVGMLKLEEK